MTVIQERNKDGTFRKGFTGNPAGRLPRQTETEYLEVTMREVTPEAWAEVIQQAILDARDTEASHHVRARAREWLAKYWIGEPSQLHHMLYKEERDIRITVTFGDNGDKKELPDIIDIEPLLLDGN